MTHELKTWPQYFQAVIEGVKTFEIRTADRPYAVGDSLHLREWTPESETYTGREVYAAVTYEISAGPFAIPGKVIMAIDTGEIDSLRADLKRKDERIAELETKLKDSRDGGDEAHSLLASATDMLNSWARESYTEEAATEDDIKGVIDRLWSHWSREIARLRSDANAADIATREVIKRSGAELDRMRQALDKALAALRLWKTAEDVVADCDNHEPSAAPETCELCFPFCDDARLALREAHDVVFRALNPQPAQPALPALARQMWPLLNRERGVLISRQVDGSITEEEARRLHDLQDFADRWVEAVAPRVEINPQPAQQGSEADQK